MRAAGGLALAENDGAFAAECRTAFDRGQKVWTVTSGLVSITAPGGVPMEASRTRSHADTLYGQLWALILDLGLVADENKLKSHLAHEQEEKNGSPFGLRVMRLADPDHPELENAIPVSPEAQPSPRDNLIWEAGSLDWSSLNLYLGANVESSLAEAHKIGKWRDQLRDQWDYKDLTTAWDGYPWCNSHYTQGGRFLSLYPASGGIRRAAASPSTRVRTPPACRSLPRKPAARSNLCGRESGVCI